MIWGFFRFFFFFVIHVLSFELTLTVADAACMLHLWASRLISFQFCCYLIVFVLVWCCNLFYVRHHVFYLYFYYSYICALVSSSGYQVYLSMTSVYTMFSLHSMMCSFTTILQGFDDVAFVFFVFSKKYVRTYKNEKNTE